MSALVCMYMYNSLLPAIEPASEYQEEMPVLWDYLCSSYDAYHTTRCEHLEYS